MRDEKLIDNLFEAARTEQAVRSFDSVQKFVETASVGTSTSLIVKWLKQNKMNILISTSGVMITATILLFPKQEIKEQNVKQQVVETPVEQVELTEETQEPIQQVEETPQPKQSVEEVVDAVEKEEVVAVSKTSSDSMEAEASVIDRRSPVQEKRTETEAEIKPQESPFSEYSVILESNKGRSSVEAFSKYLTTNLSQLKHEFTSTSNKNEIKKFTLKLDNGHEASFRMQVTGFDKLELHWEADEYGEIKDVWYRLDSKELKELDFSKSSKFSIRVKHKHEEF